jgi:cytochrome bd-type quinol oxidase subunit 2
MAVKDWWKIGLGVLGFFFFAFAGFLRGVGFSDFIASRKLIRIMMNQTFSPLESTLLFI